MKKVTDEYCKQQWKKMTYQQKYSLFVRRKGGYSTKYINYDWNYLSPALKDLVRAYVKKKM